MYSRSFELGYRINFISVSEIIPSIFLTARDRGTIDLLEYGQIDESWAGQMPADGMQRQGKRWGTLPQAAHDMKVNRATGKR